MSGISRILGQRLKLPSPGAIGAVERALRCAVVYGVLVELALLSSQYRAHSRPFSQPPVSVFHAIFDNPPLIALPATHWRKYRKEKANRSATISTTKTNNAFPSWPQATSLLPNSHLKSDEGLRNEREPWQTASRRRGAKESERAVPWRR